MDLRLTTEFKASEALTAMATASRFRTGSAPGKPRHTGQVLELGGAPNFVEQPQKILERVRSWTCTSSPMTGSYFVICASNLSIAIFAVAILVVGRRRCRSERGVGTCRCGEGPLPHGPRRAGMFHRGSD